MAPGFKLSFSRPSFRSYTSSESSPSVQSPQSPFLSRNNGTPPSLPNSKAERVLGGPELEQIPGSTKKRQASRERRSLRRLPSFMSTTSGETSADSPPQEQEFPFAGMRFPNEFDGQSSQSLRRQGSSPLLGYQANIISTSSDYFSSGSKFSTRRTETSASFKSSQSMPRSPLRLTHQVTSPSMPNLSPLGSNPHRSPQSRGEATFNQPPSFDQRGLSHSRSLSGGSARSRLTVPRRRPSVTDRPTLYPEAPRIAHAVSPPPALITSSLPKPARPLNSIIKPVNRPRWWTRTKPQGASTDHTPYYVEPQGVIRPESSVKINVKKPRAGTNHWFDSFNEDEVVTRACDDLGHKKEDISDTVEVTPVEPQADLDRLPNDWSSNNPAMLSKKSSLSSKTTHSERKVNLRFEFPASEPLSKGMVHSPKSIPILKTRESQTSSLRSAESSLGLTAGLDLQIHSVLSLSSSDEEDGFDEPMIKAGNTSFQTHTSQASVENTFYQEEVLVRSAQRAQPVRPYPVANRVPRRQSSRRSKTPERVPPVPQIPSRHPISQRSSSLRCSDILEEKAGSSTDMGGDSTIDSGSNGETPLTTPTSSCPSVYRKKPPSRSSKLMKVTSDEEKLLEAMRHKRASMHINEFQKGFNEALALQDDSSSSQALRSTSLMITGTRGSVKSSNRSLSPAPMLTSARYNGTPPRAGLDVPSNPKRISTDSYNYEEELSPGLPGEQTRFPFPPQVPPPSSKLPAPPIRLQFAEQCEVPAPKQSPTLSFSTSDMMSPSTPSTTNMPLTPPPTIMSLPPALVQGGLYRTMSENSRKVDSKLGHDRKRTVSSVVVLDGMELAAREADEERDLIGWAMDTY